MEVFWAIFGMLKNLQEILSSGVGISEILINVAEAYFYGIIRSSFEIISYSQTYENTDSLLMT